MNMRVLIVLLTTIFDFYLLTNAKVEVKVSQGKLFGSTEATVFNGRVYYAFYGVPYAESPVGSLRFKNPVPINKWKKAIDATMEYRGACPQSHIVHKYGIYGHEDCLHLNIYTPYLPQYGLRTPKSVILWIHGYAYTSGFSHIHSADFLIDNDVILVTLNHRLSAFGFLKLNATDDHTNMGLKDIVIGLKWIKKNIKYFGGDNAKVTVASSGSAASFISLLMMTKYKKLFSQVILQSGSIFSPALFQGDPIFEKINLEKLLKVNGHNDIMNAPPQDITAETTKIYESKHMIRSQRPMIPFMPVNATLYKGSLLFKSSLDIHKNIKELKFIPIMIGFNSQESITELLPFIHNPQHLKHFMQFKYLVPFLGQCKYEPGSKTYELIADMIRKRYFKGNNSEPSLKELLEYVSDLHKYPVYKFIRTYLELTETQLYVYKFNYVGNFSAAKATSIAGSNVRIKGAAHGDEICYIFKCDPLWENYVKIKRELHNRDRQFITEISEMWANFAKYGQPKRDVSWLPMTRADDNVYLLSKESKLINSRAESKMFDFWNSIYDKFYSPDVCNRESLKNEL